MRDSHDIAHSYSSTGVAGAVAMTLANALDAGDLAAAGRLLAPECACEDGALPVHGAEAVLALYRTAASWAERGFDEVRHSSVIENIAGGSVRVAVTTYLMRAPGRWHRLLHSRQFTVDADGRVVRIVHACDDAAAESFRAFVRECAIAPPPPGFGT